MLTTENKTTTPHPPPLSSAPPRFWEENLDLYMSILYNIHLNFKEFYTLCISFCKFKQKYKYIDIYVYFLAYSFNTCRVK